jgi:selenocysteine lyase/cysteine desulfurase
LATITRRAKHAPAETATLSDMDDTGPQSPVVRRPRWPHAGDHRPQDDTDPLPPTARHPRRPRAHGQQPGGEGVATSTASAGPSTGTPRRAAATWSRRQFVLATGAGALAACAGGSGNDSDDNERAGGTTSTGNAFDPGDWVSVREQFPLDPDLRHFAAFVLASHPRPVAEAIERHRQGLDADTEGYLLANEGDADYAVRANAAAYLGGDEMSTALTDSTTMGLGLLYGGLRLAEGDTVLTTEHDFFSTHEALRLRSERTGATVERVALYDDPARADAGDMVDRLVAAVTPATRVVAITWVHSGTGVKLPVPDIAEALHAAADRAGTPPPLLCVDGVHGLGSEATQVADLGCDFFVSGTHKWLFGPRGTGVVWGRAEAWPQLDAIIPAFEPAGMIAWMGGESPEPPQPGPRATPGGYHSFEHRWALAEAFAFHQEIGREEVAERVSSQATQLKEGLADVDGVTLVTPASPDLSSGIVCATLDGADPVAVMQALHGQGFVTSVTPYGERYNRFGPGIVTTPEEVDDLVEAIAGLR